MLFLNSFEVAEKNGKTFEVKRAVLEPRTPGIQYLASNRLPGNSN
jgi:hypothetical protein